MTKTGDFYRDVFTGYYQWLRHEAYRTAECPEPTVDTWEEDFKSFIASSGVPAQYVDKVAKLAAIYGLGEGERGIFACGLDLIGIFN